jgi:hypothetical protein
MRWTCTNPPKSRVQKCHWGYTPCPLRQQEWAIIQPYQNLILGKWEWKQLQGNYDQDLPTSSAMWLLGIGNWEISGISDLGKALSFSDLMADVDRIHLSTECIKLYNRGSFIVGGK